MNDLDFENLLNSRISFYVLIKLV